MNRMFRWAAMVPVFVALTLTAGCGRPLKQQVLGTWKETNGTWQVTFLKDGSFTTTNTPQTLLGTQPAAEKKGEEIKVGGRVPTFGGQALKQFGGKAGEKAGAKTGEKAGEKAGEGSPASQQITGKYTVPDEKHVKVQSEGFGKVLGPQIWGAEMKENRLTLDVNGKKTEFSKVE